MYGEPNVEDGYSEGENGANGVDGGNAEGIEYPESVELTNAAFAVNKFKYYIRENLPQNILKNEYEDLFEKLENHKSIQMLYDTMGFADELQSIVNQYYQLRNQLSFVPFIESVLNRTMEYAKNYTESNRRALILVYTIALSKLNAIRKHENRATFTDLLEQLEIVQENIDKFTDCVKELDINEYHEKYKRSLDRKIKLSYQFVRFQIRSELETIIFESNRKLPILIDSVIAYRNVTNIKGRDEISDLRRKLANELKPQTMLHVIDIIRSVLEFFGSIAKALSKEIGGETSIADVFYHCVEPLLARENSQIKNKIVGLIEAFKLFFSVLQETFRKKHKFFLKQLTDIDSEIPFNRLLDQSDWVVTIRNEMIKLKLEILLDLSTDTLIDPNKADIMRLKFRKVVEDNQPPSKRDKSLWRYILDISTISNITDEFYDQIRVNKTQIEEVANATRKLHGIHVEWEEGEKRIYTLTIPFITLIQDGIKLINDIINNSCHMELDIPKQRVQTFLKEMKTIWTNITEWTVLPRKLMPSIAKLDESFALLIDVYDRIDSYLDTAKFIAYILHSAVIHETKKNHSNILSKLTENIQMNMVLEQYNVMMDVLRLYQFPFSNVRAETLDIPKDLQLNDSKVLIRKSNNYINHLKERIKSSNLPLDEYNREILNMDLSKTESIIINSFYLWNDSIVRTEVEKLLRGEEIVIKSDITKGLVVNAMRFNEIGIDFLLANNDSQIEFDNTLEKFLIRMTVVGNNYLRCGSRFYYVSLDDEIVMERSLKKDSNGKPIKTNEAYRKITERGYFLSPYVTWKVQLITETSNDLTISDELEKFKNIPINLKLIGRGQYYKSQDILSLGICNKQMDNYYQHDNSISILNVDQMKFKYLL